MKMWLKFQFWGTVLALCYIFFIFNDGYLGKLLLEVMYSSAIEWIKGIFHHIAKSIVDSALHH